MELEERALIPVLLWGLTAFAAINLLLNFILLWILKKRGNRLLVYYWTLVVAAMLVQTQIQATVLQMVLSFSASLFPVLVMTVLAYELIDRQAPWQYYLAAWPPFLGVVLLLDHLGLGFTAIALPVSLLNALPLFMAGYALWFTAGKRTTPLQKLFGVLMWGQGLHFIHFMLLDMAPGTQLGGWMTAYVLYDVMGTVLPSIALENAGLHEKTNLEQLVHSRTQELDASLEKNRSLLKILLHDITNPIAAMGLYLSAMGEQTPPSATLLGRLKLAHGAVRDIVGSVGSRYTERAPDGVMTAQSLAASYAEMSVIFEQALQRKRISLEHHFALSPTLSFKMDKTLFTHSILGNLVSNAVKFSPPDSSIEINAREHGGHFILSVEDRGIGIPPGLLQQLDAGTQVPSRPDTLGDQGMGLGLSSVRSIVATYGGSMTISSRDALNYPHQHGTCVTVSFAVLRP